MAQCLGESYDFVAVASFPAALCSLDPGAAWIWQDQLDLLATNRSQFAPWPFSRFTTNAVYNHIDNTVYIPTGLAQLPFYSPTWDDALQLVSIGYTNLVSSPVCSLQPLFTHSNPHCHSNLCTHF